jgi:hypothetical protein
MVFLENILMCNSELAKCAAFKLHNITTITMLFIVRIIQYDLPGS